ncbi:MAG TPA: hypothetical protein VH157_08140 [Bryobacteraceae bacterium]|jgi:hypothetical protein|nr:hypothetical protein [Bryobacteraceae bacterium]
MILKRLLAIIALTVSLLPQVWGQDSGAVTPPSAPTSPAEETKPVIEQAPPDKRILGVLPNYRTTNETGVYTPITVKQKFTIASKDSFDYPLVMLGAAIAGIGQWSNDNPSFGQGGAGFARRFGTSYADQAIGNMMTEAIFPAFLREDPRYFRRGTGPKWGRTWYAATRVFVTHTDSGSLRFNYSEVLGNAAAVAISNSYYPDNRSVGGNVEKLGEQIGIDAISQVLKEFWPDIKRKLFQRHRDEAALSH